MLFFEGINTHHIWWIIKDLGQGSEWMTLQNHWGLKSKRATLSVLNHIFFFFLFLLSHETVQAEAVQLLPNSPQQLVAGVRGWSVWGGWGGENKHCMSGRKGRNVTPKLANTWNQNRSLYNLHVTAMCPLCATSWLHNNMSEKLLFSSESLPLYKSPALTYKCARQIFSFCPLGIFKGQGRI